MYYVTYLYLARIYVCGHMINFVVTIREWYKSDSQN